MSSGKLRRFNVLMGCQVNLCNITCQESLERQHSAKMLCAQSRDEETNMKTVLIVVALLATSMLVIHFTSEKYRYAAPDQASFNSVMEWRNAMRKWESDMESGRYQIIVWNADSRSQTLVRLDSVSGR